MTNTLTILIADDHPMIRHGLREAIEANEAWQIVGEAEDGDRALELIVQLRPAIAILDISMPGKNGFDVVESLRQKNSPTHVIFLTMSREVDFFQRALDLRLIQLHQQFPHPIAFYDPQALCDRLQRRHPFGFTLGAQLKNRIVRRADLQSWQIR